MLHPVLTTVTERILERSRPQRSAYLRQIDEAAGRARGDAGRMGCANVAHAFAGLPAHDKFRVMVGKAPNIAIVSSYNDMLSAHAPLGRFPDLIKEKARKQGATAPPLAVLQGRGFRVALVTDGRMSGASGKVPAAIHVSPEAAAGGPLARLRDGDVVRLDADAGTLHVLVPDREWAARENAVMPEALVAANGQGTGRELFSAFRRNALLAEEGACTWL